MSISAALSTFIALATLVLKVLKDFYPQIYFLKLEEPPNTKAIGIVQAINNAFTDIGMPDYKQQLIGFCSDEATILAKKLQDRTQNASGSVHFSLHIYKQSP